MMADGTVSDRSIECCLFRIPSIEKGVMELLILGVDSRGHSSSEVTESGVRDLSLHSSLGGTHFSDNIESTLNFSTCFWGGGGDLEVTVDDFGDDWVDDMFCDGLEV